MARKVRCPRCQSSKSWRLESGKRRCSACRYDWRPGSLPVRLTAPQWRQLLRYFLLGLSAARVAQETHLGREQVLRALLLVRQAMARDIPPVFSGVVEIDETYVGGTWRNKRLVGRAQGTKRGRGTTKQAVFGILCRGGQVWAEVVPNVEARTLLPLLHQHVRTGLGGLLGHLYQLYWRRSKGLRPPAGGPQPDLQRPQRQPHQRAGRILGLLEAAAGSQGRYPTRAVAPLPGGVCVALQPPASHSTKTGAKFTQAAPELIWWLE